MTDRRSAPSIEQAALDVVLPTLNQMRADLRAAGISSATIETLTETLLRFVVLRARAALADAHATVH